MLKSLLVLLGLGGLCAPSMAQAGRQVVPTGLAERILVAPDAPESRQVNSTTRVPARASVYNWIPASGQWSPQAVVTAFVYNAQGQVISAISSDSVTQQQQIRKTYNRGPNGVTSLYLEQEWVNSAWQNRIQWVNTLDSLGHLLGQIRQQWTNGAWDNIVRYEQEFDSHGNQTLSLNYQWANGGWEPTGGLRSDLSYDALDRVQQVLSVMIGPDGGEDVIGRNTYTYVGNTAFLASLVAEDNRPGGLTYSYKYADYAYDAQSRTTGWQTYSWTGMSWQLTGRTTRAFDPVTVGYTELAEKLTAGTWANNTQVAYSYDALGNYLGFQREQWRVNAWQLTSADFSTVRYNTTGDVVTKLNKVASGNPSTLINKSKSYYSNFQTYVLAARSATQAATRWQLYPNPSTGRVTLTGASGSAARLRTVEVLNGLGQVVWQQSFAQIAGTKPTLELGKLAAGLYTLRLQTEAGSELHRLQKE